jgi:prepilin-type N-terminal cleavage/methylation domain-containing protein
MAAGRETEEQQLDAGFSLVEVVIAMLILGIIAVSLLPPLWQGIRLATEQSTVATATRQLNGLIEEARDSPSCGTLDGIAAVRTFTDGRGKSFTTGAQLGYSCTPGTLVYIKLTASNASGTLGDVSAQIFAQ